MKKFILTLCFSVFYLIGYSTTHTISNSNYTFSPDNITIQEGDDVNFSLVSIHNAVEVSQETWNVNGSSPITGFSVPYGGGSVSALQLTVGTHYYVCESHVSMSMKGIIIVQPLSGINDPQKENDIQLFPNPVIDHFNLQFDFPELTALEIKLYDIQGRLVKNLFPKSNVNGPFFQTFQIGEETVPGVYLIKMTYGENTQIKRIIVF